ncbi:MAG: hypothetical protein AB7U79_05920 [Candidatus Izemoplasmatales bacterium]
MKKLLSIFVLFFTFFLGLAFSNFVQAAEETNIDLYPYDQEACLLATSDCTYTKVGNSHWSFNYYGHTYYVIGGSVRYGHESIDDNSDGWVDDNELAGLKYNAFAVMFINDTDSEIDILTANARTDITDVVHRKYAYFDETGTLAMFEDHVSQYYIHNDGTTETPDWRLATQTEIDAYVAEVTAGTITSGNPSSDGLTRYTYIRMALSDTDTDGYVVEPIGYLKWTNADVDTTVELDKTKWSTIIADDPNNVYVPAGWTVVSFGTNDRGTLNPKTTSYILSLPTAMITDGVAAMTMSYVDQPAVFAGITAMDDDAVTAGVNVVVDYNGTFDLPNTVSATWINMFDDTTGDIINATEHLDYSVAISQDGEVLETINFVWDDVNQVYTPSAAVSVIDSSDFGAGYKAVYSVTTPSGDVTTQEVDIVIGVMPPAFAGVENRYINEGEYVNLLEGITANDGYGNDLTDSIQVTLPEGFNFYYPLPGVYDINLSFTHHVHFDGIDPTYVLDGTTFTWNGLTNTSSTNWATQVILFTDVTNLKTTTFSWSSAGMILEVGGDGNIIRTINRRTWELVDVNGINSPADASGMFTDWLTNVTLEDGGFILLVGVSTGAPYTAADALAYDAPVSYDPTQQAVFDYDIVTEATYTLTVDDTTAPNLLVVNDNYAITVGDYTSANAAILANVVAFDNFDSQDDLAVYVSDNGGLLVGTPGTYTVEVTVEDLTGNSAVVTFDVDVVADDSLTSTDVQDLIDAGNFLSDAEIQAMFDDQTLTATEIQALIDAGVVTTEQIQTLIDGGAFLNEAEVQALIDAALAAQEPTTGCGASASILGFTSFASVSILGVAFYLLRKRH